MAHRTTVNNVATEPSTSVQDAAAAVPQLVEWLVAHVRAGANQTGTFSRFATLAADLVPGADACSITAHTPDGSQIIAASNATAMKVGRYQCRVGDGPAIRSALTGAVIEIADVGHDDLWPRFNKHAAALGVRSVLCLSAAGAGDLRLSLTISSAEVGVFRGYRTSTLSALLRDVLGAGLVVSAEQGFLRQSPGPPQRSPPPRHVQACPRSSSPSRS